MPRIYRMPKTGGYAYIAPKLRLLRLASLERDLQTLAQYATNTQAFLQAIKSTSIAPYLPESPSLNDVEKAAWHFYLEGILDIEPFLPSEAKPIVQFYKYYVLANDIAKIGKAVAENIIPRLKDLVFPDDKEILAIYTAATEKGRIGFIEGLQKIGFATAAKILSKLDVRDRRVVEIAIDAEILHRAKTVLQLLKHTPAEQVFGGRIDIIAIRATVNACLYKLPEELRKYVVEHMVAYRLNEKTLAELVAAGDIEGVIAAMRETPYGAISGSGLTLTLVDEQISLIRKFIRRTLVRCLATNPLSPCLATGVLELLLLDIEDLIVLAAAAYHRSTDVLAKLSIS
ncbi:MAG TPA: hypothetical protein EYH26_03750 [Pyrodictium sp.]|nr:hypothetical protein [Pyrodictium sp.]